MKSFTDIEQSTQLQKILPIESADMFYTSLNRDYPWIWIDKHLMEVDDIPCWSLAALLEIISYPTLSQEYDGKWSCREYQEGEEVEGYENPVDACVAMVEKLKELNLL